MWWTVLALWTSIILGVTVLPLANYVGHSHWDQVRWIPFYGHRLDFYDILSNMALFIPFGYLLRRAVHKWSRKHAWELLLLLAVGLATGIEFYQVYCHNRIPSATDICSNCFGAIIGAAISEGTGAEPI